MTTFLEDESSVESSAPIEGFEIIYGLVIQRITSAARDATIGANRFVASAVGRAEIAVGAAGDPKEMTFTLPVSHPLPQRYLLNGTPPRQISVTLWRKQRTSGAVERTWHGLVTSMALDGHVATFRVPSRLSETLQRRLPTMSVTRSCSHVLYDPQCRVLRQEHTGSWTKQAAGVTNVNGRVVTVNTLGGQADQWARYGELEHLATGERMTVRSNCVSLEDKVGVVITMQAPIAELKFGDIVIAYAGCDHDIGTCRDKFNNVVNFGGMPNLPTRNPHVPNGLGIYQSG